MNNDLTLFKAIYDFITAWFPTDVVAANASIINQVAIFGTCFVVCTMMYLVFFSWWLPGRKK